MKEAIRQRALELGFDKCGFATALAPDSVSEFRHWLANGWHGQMAYLERSAAKRSDPQQVLPGAASFIVLVANYASASGPGTVARYARHLDYHEVLTPPLEALTAYVNELGGPGTRSLWYTDSGPILERAMAERAGVGFIGKHTNLIGRDLGNWFFLCEILTTLTLEPDQPERNRCGSCSRCITACPTGAIRAPFQLDARLCISYLTIELRGPIPVELRPAMGQRIFGCDDCLEACPWNRFARAGKLMKASVRPDLAAPDLIALLELDEAAFKRRFAGTPILRARRRGLARNVCVALGNLGDPSVRPALERAARDPDPLVAEHAAWALQQLRPA